jgi:hypothetical protein
MKSRFSVAASPSRSRTFQVTPTKAKKKSPTGQRPSPRTEIQIPQQHETPKKYGRKQRLTDSGGPPQPAAQATRDLVAEYEALAGEYEELLQERNRLKEEAEAKSAPDPPQPP